MGSWGEWGPREPTLQERRAVDPGERPQRARKDRRRWCGGHVGREHIIVVRVSRHGEMLRQRMPDRTGCRWSLRYRWLRADEREPVAGAIRHQWRGRYSVIDRYVWSCDHERGCERCGKILEPFLGRADCPDYDGGPAPEVPS